MRFLVAWNPTAFDRMQDLVRRHPDLKTEFTYALRQLATELGRAADTFGESRGGDDRLGFVGPLAVLVDVSEEEQVAEVLDVALRPGHTGRP